MPPKYAIGGGGYPIALHYSQDFCVHATILFDSNRPRPCIAVQINLSENLGVDPQNGPRISEKFVTISFFRFRHLILNFNPHVDRTSGDCRPTVLSNTVSSK